MSIATCGSDDAGCADDAGTATDQVSTTRPADGLAASYPAAGETTNARTASIAGLEDTGIAFTEQVDTVCSAG